MEYDNNKGLKGFTIKIFMVSIVFTICALVLALLLRVDFGLVLFLLGLSTTALGSYLSGPARSYRENFPETSNHHVREYNDRLFHYLRTKAPKYGSENILFYSGVLTVILSLPFICQIMYG